MIVPATEFCSVDIKIWLSDQKAATHHLTHYGIVMPYGDKDLGEYRLR